MTKKSITSAIILATAFTFTVNAQTQIKSADDHQAAVKHERVVESFKTSLKSDYQGIVEGTVYNIVVYKKFYPQLDYSDLLTMLNKYSVTSNDVAIRYKAYLASLYLTHDESIEIEPVAQPADHEYIFRQIAQQIESKFMVAR